MLETNGQIMDGTLENRSLVGRTEIRAAAYGIRALMEYPLKTMNVLRKPMRYQVDTGPLNVPDLGSTEAMQVERFDITHVVYNRPDKGEFILRRPKERSSGEENRFRRSRTTPWCRSTRAGTNCSPPADLPERFRTATAGPLRRGAGGLRRIHRPRQDPGSSPPARH